MFIEEAFEAASIRRDHEQLLAEGLAADVVSSISNKLKQLFGKAKETEEDYSDLKDYDREITIPTKRDYYKLLYCAQHPSKFVNFYMNVFYERAKDMKAKDRKEFFDNVRHKAYSDAGLGPKPGRVKVPVGAILINLKNLPGLIKEMEASNKKLSAETFLFAKDTAVELDAAKLQAHLSNMVVWVLQDLLEIYRKGLEIARQTKKTEKK